MKMAQLFNVEMSPPENCWMMLEFRSGDQYFRQDFATHIHPFMDRLISALRALRTGYLDDRMVLFIGAPECELCLQADANSPGAKLRLDIWPNSKRSAFTRAETVFSVVGDREEIIHPFVTDLKALRGRVSDADFERGFGSPFPVAEYERLIAEFGSH